MLNRANISAVCILACAVGASSVLAGPTAIAAMPLPKVADVQPDTWLLHLPGIAGKRWCDEQFALGLGDARFAGSIEIYDWTGDDAGLASLHADKRNQAEAQKVADNITNRVRKQPGLRVILSGHSGGTGIAVWALEKLPDDVKIDELILMASALSPGYDLTKALAHVRGHCYSFCSENDVLVLGAGTRMVGTIDGKKTEAAGYFGFIFPPTADPGQYDKLIQKPYDKSWVQYRNLGQHMGCMVRPFVRAIIAPMIVGQANKAPVVTSQLPVKTR